MKYKSIIKIAFINKISFLHIFFYWIIVRNWKIVKPIFMAKSQNLWRILNFIYNSIFPAAPHPFRKPISCDIIIILIRIVCPPIGNRFQQNANLIIHFPLHLFRIPLNKILLDIYSLYQSKFLWLKLSYVGGIIVLVISVFG